MEIDIEAIVIVVGIALIMSFLLLLIISAVIKLQRFYDELRYINIEIHRVGPRERKVWLRRRRRLWLSLLPFYRS